MIRTPSDFIAYLRYIAQQHPQVAYVIHGDEIRVESATNAKISYPLVDIEIPSHSIPKGSDPTIMTTRVFVTDRSSQATADQDISHDRAHHIAIHIISCIKAHTTDYSWGFALADQIVIRPMVSLTSDQTRGWTFEVSIEVEQQMCLDMPFDPSDILFPQFRWVNAVPEDPTAVDITLTDASIGEGATLTWYWQSDIGQPSPAEVLPGDLTLAADSSVTRRIVQVWLRQVKGAITLWSYARIDTRIASGYSIPFTPYNPIA